jgi:hypothetical protein
MSELTRAQATRPTGKLRGGTPGPLRGREPGVPGDHSARWLTALGSSVDRYRRRACSVPHRPARERFTTMGVLVAGRPVELAAEVDDT